MADASVRVVDIVATIIAFLTVLQVRATAPGFPLRHRTAFVVAFALAA